MSLNKIELINNYVFRYKKNLTNCEVILTYITIIAQVIINAHIYK